MLLEKDMPQPHIKLIDFGLSHRIEEGVEYKSLSGTPQYIGEWNSPDPSWLCQDFWVSQNDIKYVCVVVGCHGYSLLDETLNISKY